MTNSKRTLQAETPEMIKRRIIDMFLKNVKGKRPDTSGSNVAHDGKGGHWLEEKMGVIHNSSNTPDIDGFEMKNETTSKTTFGDWSPQYRIYGKGNEYGIDRNAFLEIFGAPNPLKENRYSWSGKPVPKIGSYNSFGQKLVVDKEGNISAIYSFSKDMRPKKTKIVPKALHQENLTLAKWNAEKMKVRVERKFNNLGWFKCTMVNGVYSQIAFAPPFNFDSWINGVRKGLIFFDSGMYAGNPRPYAQWRAVNKYWDYLITERY